MSHRDHFISFPMDQQQLPSKFNYFFLIIEVLFDEASSATDQSCGNLPNIIKRRHEYQDGHFSITSQIGSPSTTNRPAHDTNITNIPSTTNQIIIKFQRIRLDSIRYKSRTTDTIWTITRVLNSIKSNIKLLHHRFQKHTNYSNIFSIAMEINKTPFW